MPAVLNSILLAALGAYCLLSLPRVIRSGQARVSSTDNRDRTTWEEISRKGSPSRFWIEVVTRIVIGIGSFIILLDRWLS